MRRVVKTFGATKMLESQWFRQLFRIFLERSDKDEVTSSNLVGPMKKAHGSIIREPSRLDDAKLQALYIATVTVFTSV